MNYKEASVITRILPACLLGLHLLWSFGPLDTCDLTGYALTRQDGGGTVSVLELKQHLAKSKLGADGSDFVKVRLSLIGL